MSAVSKAAKIPVAAQSRPERVETRVFKHELEPGQSITVDVRKELRVEGKGGRYAVAAIMELDKRWEEPTEEDIAYEALRALAAGEKPELPATHRAAYQLLWFGHERVLRNEDGSYVPFAHTGMVFEHSIAVMGEEFLGKTAHGQLITSGCRAIADRGRWIPFGPSTMGRLMDFPDGTDPVAFAVGVALEDEHLVRIANCSSGILTIACRTPEIDPLPEGIGAQPEA